MERFNPLFCYQNDSYLQIGGQNYCSVVGYDCAFQDKSLVAIARVYHDDGTTSAHGVCSCTIVDTIEGVIDDFVTEEPVLKPLKRIPRIRQSGGRPEP